MSRANKIMTSESDTSSDRTLFDHLKPLQPEGASGNEHQIGARLRMLRRELKMSIRSLAEKCGISANTLSLIENNRTSPSLHTLQLLAAGLGVALISLFEEDRPDYALVYQRHGQRPQVYFGGGYLARLGEGLPPLGAEPILVTLEPGKIEAADITHVGREFIYCLEGGASCIVSNQEYNLSPGDSILFDARAPHHWKNTESSPAKLLVLFCPMEAHDSPFERHLSNGKHVGQG
jgi:transcriptional regulator with XRE-family HTH domain